MPLEGRIKYIITIGPIEPVFARDYDSLRIVTRHIGRVPETPSEDVFSTFFVNGILGVILVFARNLP